VPIGDPDRQQKCAATEEDGAILTGVSDLSFAADGVLASGVRQEKDGGEAGLPTGPTLILG